MPWCRFVLRPVKLTPDYASYLPCSGLNECPKLSEIALATKAVVKAIHADLDAAESKPRTRCLGESVKDSWTGTDLSLYLFLVLDGADLSPNAFPMSQMQSQLANLKRYVRRATGFAESLSALSHRLSVYGLHSQPRFYQPSAVY